MPATQLARGRHTTADLLAAVTVVVLLGPECVAYAQIAGIPPAQGLAAAPIALLAYALLGRSPLLAVGPTAATAVISAATVAGLSAPPSDRIAVCAGLALLSGAILTLTGLGRFGFIARFLAPQALTGFLLGLALVVMVRQVATILGVHVGKGDFFVKAWHVGAHAGDWKVLSALVGVTCLIALVVLERRLPQIPATLLVLVLAWLVSRLLNLQVHGVAVVGHVGGGLPHLGLRGLPATTWDHLFPAALGLSLVVFVMSYSVAERVGDPDAPPLNADREMVALGLSNIGAGLFGGLPVAGSPSASQAAGAAGGRSRLTAATAAVLFVVVILTATAAFTALPEPALAAVVIAAVRQFVAVGQLRRYLRRDWRSFAIAAVAVAGVLGLDLLPGLLLAVAVSLVLFVAQASRLKVSELGSLPGTLTFRARERHSTAERSPEMLVLRPDGALFFANVAALDATVAAELTAVPSTVRVVLLDLDASFDLDLPVLDHLEALRHRLTERQLELCFVHVYLSALDMVLSSPLADVRRFETIADAAVAVVASRPLPVP